MGLGLDLFSLNRFKLSC